MEDHKTLSQWFVPLQDEALRVMGALAAVQGTMMKAVEDNEENLTTMTMQVVEDIFKREVEVKK
jgi:hypothetical protein